MTRGLGRRWLKFQAVGAAGTCVQLGSLFFLRECLSLSVLLAAAMAVEISILHNFCWHRHWTWAFTDSRLRSKPVLRQLCEYNLTCCLVSLVSNVVLTDLFMRTFGVHYLIANLMAIATVGGANFLTAELFIFRPVGGCQPGATGLISGAGGQN
jgi:dolichol-phosphate mannosyltransferase